MLFSYPLSLYIAELNGFSQQYILMTRMPAITSFIMCVRLSVQNEIFSLNNKMQFYNEGSPMETLVDTNEYSSYAAC